MNGYGSSHGRKFKDWRKPVTDRGDKIARIGTEMGKFQEGDLLELCLDALTNPGTCVTNRRENIGDGVQRYIVVEEREDEAGYLELEVRFTGWREPERRYRVQLVITEQEPS
jgi:hypothetical protein